MKNTILILASFISAVSIFPFFYRNAFDDSFISTIPVIAIERHIAELDDWEKWWPGKRLSDSSFQLGKEQTRITRFLATNFDIVDTEENWVTRVTFIPVSATQTRFLITGRFRLSRHVFTRYAQLPELKRWKQQQQLVADSLRAFFTSVERIYGFQIEKQKLQHSPHISIAAEFNQAPGVNEIYGMLNNIRNYVRSQHHKTVDSPILHVIKNGRTYRTMVAFATDTILPTSEPFFLKQMVLGTILTAKVQGGPSCIRKCMEQVDQYASDYGKASPAIPFERMITNRKAEPDTNKWITTINYPIFE